MGKLLASACSMTSSWNSMMPQAAQLVIRIKERSLIKEIDTRRHWVGITNIKDKVKEETHHNRTRLHDLGGGQKIKT
jgi:hypothetical protein